jgi:transcriptional regulator with XRE-family HTH domain
MVQSTHNSDYQLLLTVLKGARKRMGVSQVELATRLGNTQAFVSKCERGERRIDAVELVEFSEALGVPPLELMHAYLEQRGRGVLAKDRKTRRSR